MQGSQLVVSDVESAREHLLAPAVEVGPVFHYEGARRVEGPGGRWNALVAFSDPEGNGWVVQERPAGG